MKLSRLLAPVCLACLMVAAQAADGTPVRVPTVVVGNAAASTAMTLDAVLQPVRQATVTAQVGGNVLALRVKVGDRVRRGQPLVRLDDREVRANTARSDAAVAQAEAELRNAQQVLERNRALKKDGFISQAAVDNSDNQVLAAQAAVRQAQAARTQATVAQGFADLVAPFDAVVLATHVEAGDLAMPGRALVTLYEPGRMRAVVQVSASRVAIATAATEVMVVLADGQRFVPAAREMLPTADPVSQTVEWRLLLPASATQLRPGQTAQVMVRSAAAQAPDAAARLSLPAQAVLRRGELTAVYVAGPQGFALRAVRVGPAVGGVVDVLSGLRAGERVAMDPVRAGLQGASADGQ
ncbi:MAG: efflux RND transporter periplasmic adaptor subunit [Rhodoferax sp.]|nr:efflux RND transporter periplasmic adaptor subunit [Rhodoferax sp.]